MKSAIFGLLVLLAAQEPAPNAGIGGSPRVAPVTGPSKPAPRTANGKIILGPLPGESGVWLPPNAGSDRLVALDTDAPVTTVTKISVSQVPFQPWARGVYEDRVLNQLEPHTRCKPSGGPRQLLTPYGVEFVDLPELQRIYIVDLGGPHTLRIIYMDGRSHPKDLVPTYYGHSVGRWDGDTLIIDTIGFNERFWMDRVGLPHTEKLHMTERITRIDFDNLRYEVTVDDPGAYTDIWTSGFMVRWSANQEPFEYVCQDNNFASELMVGTASSVNRRSVIVP
jgi:hypothetical protein